MSRKRILVVLPSPLMARNFLGTDALILLTERLNMDVTVVSPSVQDKPIVEKHGAKWIPYFHPRKWREAGDGSLYRRVVRIGRYGCYLAGFFLHMMLTYRFNTLSGFAGFQTRLRQSWRLRRIYLRDGLPMSRLFGFPFTLSTRLYKFLLSCYFRAWQSFEPVARLMSELNPDVMLLSMVQTHMVTSYALAARRQQIPVLGINGSWDQPTTKGPLCPGISRFVVQNEMVRDELIRFHHVPKDQVAVIGWLQMDSYVRDPAVNHSELLKRVGIPKGHRYILFAANAPRLGLHEPELFKRFAALVQAGTFGHDVTLVCRCHPQDRNWEARWGWAVGLQSVVVESPDLGPLDHLAALIRNAGVVVASAGSINLDAVALDTPTIGLAWEDEELPYWDRPARAYDLEHLAELRTSSGMMFARNLDELVFACRRYLNDRSADAAGRADVRQRYLFHLDGGAAARLVHELEVMLT
jgi:hypothetical protein